MSESTWHTAKSKWPTKLDPLVSASDYLELEVVFEQSNLRSKSYIAVRVATTETLDENGLTLSAVFIGSDDTETNNASQSGSQVRVHLCALKRGDRECHEEVQGVHTQRWRRHTAQTPLGLSLTSPRRR